MAHRLVSLILLAAFGGSTIGLPLPLSPTSPGGCDRSLGCKCSQQQRQAGNCCCQSEANRCCQKKQATSGCCQSSTSADGDEDASHTLTSRCGCGETFPGLLVNGNEPRLVGECPMIVPHQPMADAVPIRTDTPRLVTLLPDEPVPRTLAV